MKVCVYAFSNTALLFAELIRESRRMGDGVEWSAILPRWHHRATLGALLAPEKIQYLYEKFDERFHRNGDSGFAFSPDADNELLCLLKDKGGYLRLESEDQLRRAATVTCIYREFLLRERPDYLLFPDVEVVDGFLLLSLCKTLGITPIYYIGMRFLGGGFFSSDCYESLPEYYGTYSDHQLAKAKDFLNGFLAGHVKAIDPLPECILPPSKRKPFWKRVPKALAQHFRFERMYVGEDGWAIRLKANLGAVLQSYRQWFFKFFQLRWFDLKCDSQPLPEKFVLYGLQYTPESSINGLEPYYVDQMRAIDLLLAGMPSGYRLVVKEHPAIVGVRETGFYRRLRRRPGVILAAPRVNTRRLMERADIIASVTGTIGLESYLLGKPCLLFGRNFFSHLCELGEGPSSIKRVMTKLATDFKAPSVEDRAIELAKLINVRYPIELADPQAVPVVLSDQNISAFLSAMHAHIARLSAHHSSI